MSVVIGLIIMAVAVSLSYLVGGALAIDTDPFMQTAWGFVVLLIGTGIGALAHLIGEAVHGR